MSDDLVDRRRPAPAFRSLMECVREGGMAEADLVAEVMGREHADAMSGTRCARRCTRVC
jgi:hypothetical protein